MGGMGSGQWPRLNRKATVDGLKKIDIRYLSRHRLLKSGYFGTLSWRRGDESVGKVWFIVHDDHLVIKYRIRSNVWQWHDVEQKIRFGSTPCNYGGARQWFLCPHCGKRVAVLYGAGTRFLCRHCNNLSYESRNEDFADRMRRKARKIRGRLGASGDLFEPVLFKPKGMHQKTFDRLRRAELSATQATLTSMVKELELNSNLLG